MWDVKETRDGEGVRYWKKLDLLMLVLSSASAVVVAAASSHGTVTSSIFISLATRHKAATVSTKGKQP